MPSGSLRLSGGKICEDFGVSSRNSPENGLDYFIGIRTEDAVGDVSGTQEIAIAGGAMLCSEHPSRHMRTLSIPFTVLGST